MVRQFHCTHSGKMMVSIIWQWDFVLIITEAMRNSWILSNVSTIVGRFRTIGLTNHPIKNNYSSIFCWLLLKRSSSGFRVEGFLVGLRKIRGPSRALPCQGLARLDLVRCQIPTYCFYSTIYTKCSGIRRFSLIQGQIKDRGLGGYNI